MQSPGDSSNSDEVMSPVQRTPKKHPRIHSDSDNSEERRSEECESKNLEHPIIQRNDDFRSGSCVSDNFEDDFLETSSPNVVLKDIIEKVSIEESDSDGSDFSIVKFDSSHTESKNNGDDKSKYQVELTDEEINDRSSWVQCDKPECGKWRKIESDDLSSLSNGRWICSMNADSRRNNCEFSQETLPEESDDESIHTTFNPGTLVLGKMAGYPWWPGIIENDPDYKSFFCLEERSNKRVVSYHVTFFGKEVSRAWLTEFSIQFFKGTEELTEIEKMSSTSKGICKGLGQSLLEAKKAITFSKEKRLEKYGFLARYKESRKSSDNAVNKKERISKEIRKKDQNGVKSTLTKSSSHRKKENKMIREAPFQEKKKDSYVKDSKKKKEELFNRKQTARQFREEKEKRSKDEKEKRKIMKLENKEKQRYKSENKATVTEESTQVMKGEKTMENGISDSVMSNMTLTAVQEATCHVMNKEEEVKASTNFADENKESEKAPEKVKAGDDLSEREKHADRMVEKYITPEKRRSLLSVNSEEDINERHRKIEEKKRVKQEKFNMQMTKKEQKLKAKQMKEKERSKGKQLKVEIDSKSMLLKAENKFLREDKKHVKKKKSTSDPSSIGNKDCLKNDDFNSSQKPISRTKEPSENIIGDLKSNEEVTRVAKEQAKENIPVTETEVEENIKKERKNPEKVFGTQSKKLKKINKEMNEQEPFSTPPKLVKIIVPDASSSDVMLEMKEEQSKLVKKSMFKAPKRKPSFVAPTRSKMNGGKRPHAVVMEELEISTEDPLVKKTKVKENEVSDEVDLDSLIGTNVKEKNGGVKKCLEDSPEF